jgi:hypothetical protein
VSSIYNSFAEVVQTVQLFCDNCRGVELTYDECSKFELRGSEVVGHLFTRFCEVEMPVHFERVAVI